jgi:hypothetical protein
MGASSPGFLSDLSLSVDEFTHIDKLMKNDKNTEARKFKHARRYRDDITSCNHASSPNITNQIHFPNLALTTENDNDLEATVLDMDVKITQRNFITKVYCKTDDFPLFAKYGIMKVEDIIRHQQRIDGFLAMNHHLPSSINSLLISPSEVNQHFTRAAGFSLRSKHHYKSSIITATAASFNDFAKQVDPMDLSESSFRKKSNEQILESYEDFECTDGGCYICNELRDLHIAMPHSRGYV